MIIGVTGATGFIGRYVVDELIKRNVQVIGFNRNADTSLRSENSLYRNVNLDVKDCSEEDLEHFKGLDGLIHLAWGGLPNYRSNHHISEELPGQYKFLHKIITAGLPKLTVSGTCFEYGMQCGSLEETSDLLPDNCYGFAKNVLREKIEFLKRDIPYSLVWARLFYPFGEGQGPKSLKSQLVAAIKNGDDTFNMSGGEQLRDYLPVEKVAEYLVDLTLSDIDCGPVNICSGNPISIRRLVETWVDEYKSEIRLNLGFYPYPDYEPLAFWGSNVKLDTLLGVK